MALATGIACAQDLPGDVKRMLDTFNDEKIQFREEPLALGSKDAKLTAVLFYAPSCIDSAEFMRNAFGEIKKNYIDTNKVQLIIYDYPLNWRDMQLISGLRCLASDKQLEAMIDAADRRLAQVLRKTTFTSAPGYFTSTLAKLGLSEEQAGKCMRNLEIIGHVEGMRKFATEELNVLNTPTLLVGNARYTNISNAALVSEIFEKHLKQ